MSEAIAAGLKAIVWCLAAYSWTWFGLSTIRRRKLSEAKSAHAEAAAILVRDGQPVPEDMPTHMAEMIVAMSRQAHSPTCNTCGLSIERMNECDGGNCSFGKGWK